MRTSSAATCSPSTGPPPSATGSCTFSAALPNGETQRSALVATPAAAAAFGLAGDCALPPGDYLNPAGGAACWAGVDCVAWGAVTGTAGLGSAVGTPAPAIASGMSLTRSIAPGCPTLLEVSDDTNDSAANFALAAPSPANNASPPSGSACGPGGGDPGGPGPGGDDTKSPDTKIKKPPKAKTTRRKVKITFSSTEQGSDFRCKLDKGGFKPCDSPFKGKVDVGKHKFKVFAIDAAGNADPTPAKAKFKRVEA